MSRSVILGVLAFVVAAGGSYGGYRVLRTGPDAPADIPPPTMPLSENGAAASAAILTPDVEQATTLVSPPQIHSAPLSAPRYSDADRVKARAKKQHIKEERKARIVTHVKTYGKISNDEIEKLLEVSDTTAAKYTKELVQEGLLIKQGRGWQTVYVVNGA